MGNELIENIDRLHTTEMGAERIKRNLVLPDVNAAEWCRSRIADGNAVMEKQGKNWYIRINGCVITVNASSYTIITAHKEK